MDQQINKEDWKEFFVNLTKRRFEWMTRVEVIGTNVGDQTLSGGLPLNGITVEEKGDRTLIYLSLGETVSDHQTHTIEDPVVVAFREASDSQPEVIDIERANGTKTLVRLIEPMGVLVGFSTYEYGVDAAFV